MKLHSRYQAILFDFDGVLVESTYIKTQAFYQLYLPYGKIIAKKAVDHHLQHMGIARYEKSVFVISIFFKKKSQKKNSIF